MTDPHEPLTVHQVRDAWKTLLSPGQLIGRFPPHQLYNLAQQDGLDYLTLLRAFKFLREARAWPPGPLEQVQQLLMDNADLAALIAGHIEHDMTLRGALADLMKRWHENAHGARLSTFYTGSPDVQCAHAHAMERAADELKAALPPFLPPARPRWQHVKTGGIYTELHRACLEADLTEVVVYQSAHTGEIWVRPLAEFMDGRFVPEEREQG